MTRDEIAAIIDPAAFEAGFESGQHLLTYSMLSRRDDARKKAEAILAGLGPGPRVTALEQHYRRVKQKVSS